MTVSEYIAELQKIEQQHLPVVVEGWDGNYRDAGIPMRPIKYR